MQVKGYVVVDTCSKECQHTQVSFATVCCIKKVSHLVPCRETKAVYWKNHLNHVNILCERNADFLYYWPVCSKDFNLPFKSVHCLCECHFRLLSSVYYNYLFPLFYCPQTSFRRTVAFFKGFRGLWLSGQVPGQNLEPGHDFFFLRAFLFVIHYLIYEHGDVPFWVIDTFLVNNKKEKFANRSPLNCIVKFLIICL
jgi:hypothetical protein